MVPGLRLALVLSSLLTAGCGLRQIHLHNESDYLRSKRALDSWTKVQAEPALKTALTNLQKIGEAELTLVETQERSVLANLIIGAPSIRWKAGESSGTVHARVLGVFRRSLQDQLRSEASVARLQSELADKQAALASTRNEVAKAEQDSILNKEALRVPDLPQALIRSLTTLQVALERLNRESQPGLRTVIRGFTLDLARSTRERLDEEVRTVAVQRSLLVEQQKLARRRLEDCLFVLRGFDGGDQDARTAANLAIAEMTDLTPEQKAATDASKDAILGPPFEQASPIVSGSTVLDTLQTIAEQVRRERGAAFARPTEGERNLSYALQILQRYIAITGYQSYYTRAAEHQRIIEEHAHKLRLDAINARERERIIGRGIEALTLFHRGGITQDDITRAILLGQMLALVIQGR